MAVAAVVILLALSQQPCDEAVNATIRALAQQAVEQAFRDYIEHLYGIWMREETPDQAARIERGMAKAIRAYLYSRRTVDKWKGTCP